LSSTLIAWILTGGKDNLGRMRCFAITYPQLMNQAIAAGWREDALAHLRRAHEFAEEMSDGLYRAQGVPFLCHLIRTASIALAESQPPAVVSAALLHAAYLLHAFDGSRRVRRRKRHRGEMKQAVGAEVEELIWEYNRLPWYRVEALQTHLAEHAHYPDAKRRLLLLRLANELEDRMDRAIAYTARERQRRRAAADSLMTTLAEALGHRELAAELAAANAANASFEAPDALILAHLEGYERRRHHLWERHPVRQRLRSWSRRLRGKSR
jgi:(p)ppGpp synthase/HD superfamily hydrolase